MAFYIALVLSLVLTVETKSSCLEPGLDQGSLLQTKTVNFLDQQFQDAQKIGATIEAAGTATRAEAAKMERSLQSMSDAAKEVQAARDTTNAAVGFETQASESMKLAYQEAKQAEEMQAARAYEETNVTSILHQAVQQLAASAPFGTENNALLQNLRKAETAQATMLKDASQEDQALMGLSSTMATAAQAATTAKLVAETQTSQNLDSAITKLQAVQGTQLADAKDTVTLAKELEGLDAKHTVQLLQSAADEKVVAEDKELKARLTLLEAQLNKAESDRSSEQAALAEAQKQVQASSQAVQKMDQVRSEAALEHTKAELAKQQAAAMFQAASATQAALEGQASKTAQSLMRVSAEASHAAQLLQGALASVGSAR